MGIFGNIFSGKRSKPAFPDDLATPFGGADGKLGMDTGMPGDGFGDDKILNMPPTKGMPDLSAYRGAGDSFDQDNMNRSLNQQLGPERPSAFSPFQQQQPQMQQAPQNQEMAIVSAKLDAIRATLDAINQRISNIERIQYTAQEEQKKNRW